MARKCDQCGKEVKDTDKCRFFPEDDSCVCVECLKKTAENKPVNK